MPQRTVFTNAGFAAYRSVRQSLMRGGVVVNTVPDGDWIAEVNDVDTRFRTKDDLIAHLSTLEPLAAGSLSVQVDRGPTKGWLRFLGGAKRDIEPCFTVEWAGSYASLIFHDDAWSEYRAIDHEQPVVASEDERRKIAHGELAPHPTEECMAKTRAFVAIREFLESGARPNWLRYRYVE